MKKLLALLLVLVFVFALSACDNRGDSIAKPSDKTKSTKNQTETNNNIITRDRAIELALNHAGLQRSDIYDLEAELDRERVGIYWEVDFENGGFEYSYDINAETEEVFKLEKERDR